MMNVKQFSIKEILVGDRVVESDAVEDDVDRIISQWAHERPGLDVSAMEIFGRLSKLSRLVDRELDTVFAAHTLQAGEFDILATLVRADSAATGLTAGELAASAMVTSGAITNRLDRLVAKGLVTRETDKQSRRTIRVSLTPLGQQTVDAALLDHVANEERLLSTFTRADRAAAERVLRALLRAVQH